MRGHVRKRRSWEFIVDVGNHPLTGNRRQKSKCGFATKKQAGLSSVTVASGKRLTRRGWR